MPETKEWTLMFYFASDNPLAPSIIPQLKSIKQAGFHQQVNVVAQFDPQPEGTPVHIFDVNLVNKLKARDESQIGFSGFTVDDPFVSNLIEDKLWRDQKDRHDKLTVRERLRESLRNLKRPVIYDPPTPPLHTKPVPPSAGGGAKTFAASGRHRSVGRHEPGGEPGVVELNPGESLQAFLKFCAEEYPARHYILFILGHGVVVGNDVFLFDEHADEHSLSLAGLGTVLSWFRKHLELERPGAEFELVSFHSCSVSSIEVAYELKGTANYMLASQGPAFVGSWPYRQILIRLFKDVADLRGLEEKAELDPENEKMWREQIRGMIARTFCKITDYCFHNSKDFLLAGYSFDVTLCRLNGISEYFTDALSMLRVALIAGLEDEYNPFLTNNHLTRKLILLAHLEAQSEWQESYTDLHDFCFCLRRQCTQFRGMLKASAEAGADETLRKLDDIITACDEVTKLFPDDADSGSRRVTACDELTKALPDDAGGGSRQVIFKSEFVGPEHQYSHGLSIYFPWSRPLADRLIRDGYKQYKFNVATGWLEFLDKYFDKTQRHPRQAEINEEIQRRVEEGKQDDRPRPDGKDEPRPGGIVGVWQQTPDEELSEDLASLVFGSVGQLSGENSLATLEDKVNPRDKTGDVCTCASIKNYPRDTRDLSQRQRKAANPRAGEGGVPISQGRTLVPNGTPDNGTGVSNV